MKRIVLLAGFTLISSFLVGQAHYPGQHQGKFKIEDNENVTLKSFDLHKVRLLDSHFKENMMLESEWMMSFPVQRLLHTFRTNAGVWSDYEGGHYAVEPLGGWESFDSDLRGHGIGHLLSGLALIYASTGEEQYLVKADSLVKGLAEVQTALGESGYLSAFPEYFINRNFRGESLWAPWYTLHKIMAGLTDLYLYTNNEEALEVVLKMSSWAYNKLKDVSEETRALMLRNEFGGMNDVFFALYAITGNPEHKWLANFFYHNMVLDPLAEGKDVMQKMHANTFVPKLIGLTRDYEMGGSERNLKIADFFWKTVVNDHSYITGNNDSKEKFIKSSEESMHLTGYTAETCDMYNMMKLTHHLHSLNPNPEFPDFYEKVMYNTILGQVDPNTSMVTYFNPFLPGGHKVYSTYDQSWWCCVGSSFESHNKYGEYIYQHNDQDMFVNLFIPSILTWDEKGIKLTQQTKMPENNSSMLSIETKKAQRFALNIRVPEWAESVKVKVNGKKQKNYKTQNGYVVLSRTWSNKDEVEIVFGIELKAVPTADNPDIIAFKYGPYVLAGRLGTEGMEDPAPISDPTVRNDYYTYDYKVPEALTNKVSIDIDNLSKEFTRMPGEGVNFKMLDRDIVFSPLAEIHHERYSVYWDNK